MDKLFIFNELLKENGIVINNILSEDQEKAFELCKKRKNIVVLGSGGSGKSFFINYIKDYYKGKFIAVTSTTGISAFNIGGLTLHSFIGFGNGEKSVDLLLRKMNSDAKKRIRNLEVLIIDEISMLSAELFEKINKIFQIIRKNTNFFGNIQVVLCGDFFQLLPVFKNPNDDRRLLVESDLFKKNFNKNNTIVLKKNYRQDNDKIYYNLLEKIRKGIFDKEDIALLKQRIGKIPEADLKNCIQLVSSNKKATLINNEMNKQINSEEKIYHSHFSLSGDDNITNVLKNDLEYQFEKRGMNKLLLKIGSRIMLIKNVNVSNGLVNGATGIITNFKNGNPIIKFDKINEEIEISTVEFEVELNSNKVIGHQLPLILAWALTIHKSQSLTLDNAYLDLDDCFCDAQVYVALSRLKSLNGIFLKSFDENKIKVNETVSNFYKEQNFL